jgi:hypothetical protein
MTTGADRSRATRTRAAGRAMTATGAATTAAASSLSAASLSSSPGAAVAAAPTAAPTASLRPHPRLPAMLDPRAWTAPLLDFGVFVTIAAFLPHALLKLGASPSADRSRG